MKDHVKTQNHPIVPSSLVPLEFRVPLTVLPHPESLPSTLPNVYVTTVVLLIRLVMTRKLGTTLRGDIMHKTVVITRARRAPPHFPQCFEVILPIQPATKARRLSMDPNLPPPTHTFVESFSPATVLGAPTYPAVPVSYPERRNPLTTLTPPAASTTRSSHIPP